MTPKPTPTASAGERPVDLSKEAQLGREVEELRKGLGEANLLVRADPQLSAIGLAKLAEARGASYYAAQAMIRTLQSENARLAQELAEAKAEVARLVWVISDLEDWLIGERLPVQSSDRSNVINATLQRLNSSRMKPAAKEATEAEERCHCGHLLVEHSYGGAHCDSVGCRCTCYQVTKEEAARPAERDSVSLIQHQRPINESKAATPEPSAADRPVTVGMLAKALRRAAHAGSLGSDGQNALHYAAQELEQEGKARG